MNAISNLLRTVAIVVVAVVGIAMAAVLMISTAIALGVLYLLARVRGRPFAPARFWQPRNPGWQFAWGRSGFQRSSANSSGTNPHESNDTGGFKPRRSLSEQQIIDVEVRDLP